MAKATKDPKFAKEYGIDPAVAKEFLEADKGKHFKPNPKKPSSSQW